MRSIVAETRNSRNELKSHELGGDVNHRCKVYRPRMRRYTRPPAIPRSTPMMSAAQSLTSALRLNVGCISSMAPPNALAPMKTGSRPKRPVRARGKASAAKAMKWTILSLPAGAGGGWSRGQSIATVSAKRTMSVRGMSRYLRMGRVYWPHTAMASVG